MGITGFTLPTLYRWIKSEQGREQSLYPLKEGLYLGSGKADKVIEEAGLDGANQFKAILEYVKRKGIKVWPKKQKDWGVWFYWTSPPTGDEDKDEKRNLFDEDGIKRDDPDLVEVVLALGKEANGDCADLKVVEIPYGVKWEIAEYDGNEHVAEVHRTWY